MSVRVTGSAIRKHPGGFTLVELLVVLALIAGLAALLLSGLRGGGKSAALRAGQAALANLVTVARTRALASGQSSRLLFHIDAGSQAQPARYLRYVVLQTQAPSGWTTITDAFLSADVYVVPGNFAGLPAGVFADGAARWVRADGVTGLRSTALRSNQFVTEAVNAERAELWAVVTIAAAGTTSQSGDLVLAAGRVRAPGSFADGESPVELVEPDTVRGLALSAYGVTAFIDERASF